MRENQWGREDGGIEEGGREEGGIEEALNNGSFHDTFEDWDD
jgi:hypothetical protein